MKLEKKQIFELQRLLPNTDFTYIYGNKRVIHSESIELVGTFHNWKICHKGDHT